MHYLTISRTCFQPGTESRAIGSFEGVPLDDPFGGWVGKGFRRLLSIRSSCLTAVRQAFTATTHLAEPPILYREKPQKGILFLRTFSLECRTLILRGVEFRVPQWRGISYVSGRLSPTMKKGKNLCLSAFRFPPFFVFNLGIDYCF